MASVDAFAVEFYTPLPFRRGPTRRITAVDLEQARQVFRRAVNHLYENVQVAISGSAETAQPFSSQQAARLTDQPRIIHEALSIQIHRLRSLLT